jgi:hypothetical protein
MLRFWRVASDGATEPVANVWVMILAFSSADRWMAGGGKDGHFYLFEQQKMDKFGARPL